MHGMYAGPALSAHVFMDSSVGLWVGIQSAGDWVPVMPGFSGLILSRLAPSQWETSLQCNTVSHWRADSRLAPSQWEMSLQCSTISHWRADSRLAPSQWDTSLQCNTVSHWLGATVESTLGSNPGQARGRQLVSSWFKITPLLLCTIYMKQLCKYANKTNHTLLYVCNRKINMHFESGLNGLYQIPTPNHNTISDFLISTKFLKTALCDS